MIYAKTKNKYIYLLYIICYSLSNPSKVGATWEASSHHYNNDAAAAASRVPHGWRRPVKLTGGFPDWCAPHGVVECTQNEQTSTLVGGASRPVYSRGRPKADSTASVAPRPTGRQAPQTGYVCEWRMPEYWQRRRQNLCMGTQLARVYAKAPGSSGRVLGFEENLILGKLSGN